MWTCVRAVDMLESGELGGRARRSCWTSRATEKLLSVSMIATHEFLPPRLVGRIAAAVIKYRRWVVPLPGACEASSRMGGLAGGFALSRMAILMILSSPEIPK
jgi:hypothetical protein